MGRDLTLTVGAHRIRVRCWEDADDAAPAILVHGLGVSGAYMVPLARELARTRRVYVPDLPGHDRSSTPRRVLDERAQASVVVAVARHLSPDAPVVLVGNSWGGQIAVEACLTAPTDIAAAVLLGPTVDPRHPGIVSHAFRLAALGFLEPPQLNLLQCITYLRTGVVRTVREFRHAQRHDMLGAASRVRQPVLIADGDLDPIISNEWMDELARTFATAATASLHDAAHVLNWRPADRVAAAIDAFLDARVQAPFTERRRGDTPPNAESEERT